ncbi:uncharacterized protein METZ01_LOCUS493093, partial [marine metagenome]
FTKKDFTTVNTHKNQQKRKIMMNR